MFNIEEELKKLPGKPGVYIMKDKEDKIIYIGKAVSLKNRVRQYFRKNDRTTRIEKMIELIDHFEYIVVDSEAEALILECNLIKENRPKFNVLLKDDKSYPYIKINVKEDFPSVVYTRKILNDGAKYFGPYANPGAAKEMMDFIKEKYKVRQCKTLKERQRPCIYYQINKCIGPCVKNSNKEEYREQIEEIISLLDGKTDKIIRELENKMRELSLNLKFEEAANLRDRIIAITRVSEKQKVSNINENSIDVIGMAKLNDEICLEIFFVRKSKMVGKEHYFYSNLNEMEDNEILSGFLKQYYVSSVEIPNKVMIREELEEKDVIEEWLSTKLGKKVEIKSPKKGEKLRFLEMAEMNSKVTLENKQKNKNLNEDILNEIKTILNLEKIPNKIETYDISNISGEHMVAAMCVMEKGIIKRNLSRRFKIKTVYAQDDPKCMEEVVRRRLKHSVEENESGFGKLPDLILADGGITQIRAIKRVIDEHKLDIMVCGMVKNDKHQTRALMNEKREELEISNKLKNLITVFQDTVHDTAITYHRKLRDKEMIKSELDDIKGIGKAKKQELLKTFGSFENIKRVTDSELLKIKGITQDIVDKIKNNR